MDYTNHNPTIAETIETYERLLREYEGNPPRDRVVPLIRQHGFDEKLVIELMLEVEDKFRQTFRLVKSESESGE